MSVPPSRFKVMDATSESLVMPKAWKLTLFTERAKSAFVTSLFISALAQALAMSISLSQCSSTEALPRLSLAVSRALSTSHFLYSRWCRSTSALSPVALDRGSVPCPLALAEKESKPMLSCGRNLRMSSWVALSMALYAMLSRSMDAFARTLPLPQESCASAAYLLPCILVSAERFMRGMFTPESPRYRRTKFRFMVLASHCRCDLIPPSAIASAIYPSAWMSIAVGMNRCRVSTDMESMLPLAAM